MNNPPEKSTTQSVEISQEAGRVLNRIKESTKIPKRYLVERAILEYLPEVYEVPND